VTDGGEQASVKSTKEFLPKKHLYMLHIEERLCLCHQLNNAIKRMIQDFFGTVYLTEWRHFISQINYSNPFNELFLKYKKEVFGENDKNKLQKDTETR
jgi:hypothetical protein